MSSNGDASSSRNSQQTPAIDVSFSPVVERDDEASSRARSKDLGKRSDGGRNGSKAGSPSKENGIRHHHSGARAPKGSGHKHRRSAHGFLLDSFLSSNRSSRSSEAGESTRDGKKRAGDGDLRRDVNGSQQSSVGSSPLAREMSRPEKWDASPQARYQASRPPSVDPAQLVQMALNLSEGRKRHVSNSLRVQVPAAAVNQPVAVNLPAAANRPTTSTGTPEHHGTVRLKQRPHSSVGYAHDAFQRSDARAAQPSAVFPVAEGSPSVELFPDFEDLENGDVIYTFTPATRSRAEKARKYFELAAEHRRMLDYLPPLKPDSTAPANSTFPSMSSPGEGHPAITGMPSDTGNQYELGRKYNPLQALRNRRLRTRERRTLGVPPDGFQDIDAVKEWVDSISAAASSSSFRVNPDKVELPTFTNDGTEDTTSQPISGRNSVSSVLAKPVIDWSIDPTELMADAYWTENGNNKALLEDRSSHLLFPDHPTAGTEKGRQSNEVRSSMDKIDEAQPAEAGHESSDSATNKKRKKKNRLRIAIHGPEQMRIKGFGRARASSDTSLSSVESHVAAAARGDGDVPLHGLGALERHMADLIRKDERGELSSPSEPMTADHWDGQFTFNRHRTDSIGKRSNLAVANGNLSAGPDVSHQRSKSADGRIRGNGKERTSFESTDSRGPSSPIFSSIARSLKPDLLTSFKGSESKHKSRLSTSSLFRSNSKERNNIESTDFADPSEANDEQGAASPVEERPRFSFDSLRPLPVQVQRNKAGDGTPNGSRQGNAKDGGSTVGRMLKSIRPGGAQRNEGSKLGGSFRYRDKFGDIGEDARVASDASDNEGRTSWERSRPGTADGDDSELSPRQSFEGDRPKFFMGNLPTFKSAFNKGNRDAPSTPGSVNSDRRLPARNRGERSSKPRIILSNGSANQSQVSLATSQASGRLQSQRSTPNGSRVSLLPGASNERKDAAKSSLGGSGRHWSISYFQPPKENQTVKVVDIARARALILASGIKARELRRQGNSPRDSPWPNLTRAIDLTGQDPGVVTVRQEPVVVARLLSGHLEKELSGLDKTVEKFKGTTVRTLARQMDELKQKVADKLTITCHEASDEADAFTAQLAAQCTMDVKNVEDSIDEMVRRRMRQFRLLRRVGFALLEYMVLSLMWGIWFIVAGFNTLRAVIVAIFRIVRWLVTF